MSAARQRGVSLIEVLVALAAGLFLTAGILQVFSGSNQAYRVGDASSRTQENARLAMELLARDLRMAGYLGCAGPNREVESSLSEDLEPLVEGLEATGEGAWTPALEAGATGSAVEPLGYRDIVTVRGAFDVERGVAIEGMDAGATGFVVSPNPDWPTYVDRLVASTCERAWLLEIAPPSGNLVTPNPNDPALIPRFLSDGELLPVETRSFFIAENPAGMPALYRRTERADREELVEGVEDMQVRYGQDTDGDGSADRFVTADAVAGGWDEVVSVRVCLLLRSLEDGLTDAPAPACEGSQVPLDGAYLRRQYTATIALRNLLP